MSAPVSLALLICILMLNNLQRSLPCILLSTGGANTFPKEAKMITLTHEEVKFLVNYCMESKENTWLALAIGQIQKNPGRNPGLGSLSTGQ